MRNRSNTPLQALATLNDPVLVECAQALGRDLALLSETPAERFQVAGARCLSREFSNDEVSVLLSLFASQLTWFRQHPTEAQELVGEYAAPGVSDTVTAAWIAVSRAILNLDELLTRE